MKQLIAAILLSISAIANAAPVSVVCTGTETTTSLIKKKLTKEVSKIEIAYTFETGSFDATEKYTNFTQNVSWAEKYDGKPGAKRTTIDRVVADDTTVTIARGWTDRTDDLYYKVVINRLNGNFTIKTDSNDDYLRVATGTCQKMNAKF